MKKTKKILLFIVLILNSWLQVEIEGITAVSIVEKISMLVFLLYIFGGYPKINSISNQKRYVAFLGC